MSSDYREDLAWIHHTGFGEFAEAAAPGLLEIIRSGAAGSTPLVVDVGCGSGILARELTRAGFRVIGFDASPAMIALARGVAPEATFEVGSFNTIDLAPCAAITAIGEVLNYGTREDLAPFFKRAAAALEAGGVLVFDIAERGAYPAHTETRVGDNNWSVIAISDSDGERLTRRIFTFRMVGDHLRRSEEVHEVELYARDDVKKMLREAGFSVTIRRSYGTRRLPKGHAVYIAILRPARRPAPC